MRIEACLDSHVHWVATGEFSERLQLGALSGPGRVIDLKVQPAHAREDWLIGFGWDDSKWTEPPHRKYLDKVFGEKPVAFTRVDGHALWVNSAALKRAGLLAPNLSDPAGGRIPRDSDGTPTGVLLDHAREPIEKLIPRPSGLEMRRHLLKGVKLFNDAGFTHIRDMTCDERQWNEAVRLDESGLLTLAVEEFFWLRRFDEFDAVLATAERARQTRSSNLRVKGLKIFLDGALGSEGAWLSRCYHGRDHSGLVLWEKAAVREVLLRCWKVGFEVAAHAIGDAAADWLIGIALELKAGGHTGALHMEHAEILRPETVTKMKGLAIFCHLQPSHWLSDRKWLKDKIADLADSAFPWRRLQEAGVEFDFGSDSPMEPASLGLTFQALRESAEAGIPRLLGSPLNYMSHKDLSWAPNSFTLLENEVPTHVVFRGEHLV